MKTELVNGGKYAAPLPYPEFDEAAPDPRFARTLDVPRAGELQTVSDYIYYGIIFERCYPWLSTMLEGIAVTEMDHFRILSELTLVLGQNPAVNVRMRNAPVNIVEDAPSAAPRAAVRILRICVDEEKASADEYAKLARMTEDPAVSAVLSRIAADEALHASLLLDAVPAIPLG